MMRNYANEINKLVIKWEEYLVDCYSDMDKKTLAVLLANCKSYVEITSEENQTLNQDQQLWLTQQGWLRSKLRKIIAVQPLLGPTSLVFKTKCNESGLSIVSQEAAAKTSKYNFQIFVKAPFETVKEIYADALANEIDGEIFTNMKNNVSLETILDAVSLNSSIKLSYFYDYIVGSKALLNILRGYEAACEGVELFEVPPVVMSDSFEIKAIAGRYPGPLSSPILLPYVMLIEGPILAGGTRPMMMRSAWVD